MLRKRAADARACWHGILKHPVDPEGQELLDGDAMGLRADAAWFDELADLLSLPDIPGPGAGQRSRAYAMSIMGAGPVIDRTGGSAVASEIETTTSAESPLDGLELQELREECEALIENVDVWQEYALDPGAARVVLRLLDAHDARIGGCGGE